MTPEGLFAVVIVIALSSFVIGVLVGHAAATAAQARRALEDRREAR